MAAKSSIEWTDATWNPIRGCSRVSEGCRNCYAEKVAYRFSGPGQPYEGLVRINAAGERKAEWNGEVRFVEKHLLDPLKWKEPRRIFVNSMSDLFHENVRDEWIDRIFAVMALCPQHTFQILTKRPERMLAYLSAPDARKNIARAANLFMRSDRSAANSDALAHVFLWRRFENAEIGEYANYLSGIADRCWPLPNIWLGVSVEDQKAADERIPLLLETPAAVRFISAEPLLGPISFRWATWDTWRTSHPHFEKAEIAEGRNGLRQRVNEHDGLRMLDWAIIGGESGPGARPMHPNWVRSLRDQCQAAGVPFFFKQWGEWLPSERSFISVDVECSEKGLKCPTFSFVPDEPDPKLTGTGKTKDKHIRQAMLGGGGQGFFRVGKHVAGAELDGREWREFPEEAHE